MPAVLADVSSIVH